MSDPPSAIAQSAKHIHSYDIQNYMLNEKKSESVVKNIFDLNYLERVVISLSTKIQIISTLKSY